MSEEPHIRAYLCDDCWYSMPHYKVTNVKRVKKEHPKRIKVYLKDQAKDSLEFVLIVKINK